MSVNSVDNQRDPASCWLKELNIKPSDAKNYLYSKNVKGPGVVKEWLFQTVRRIVHFITHFTWLNREKLVIFHNKHTTDLAQKFKVIVNSKTVDADKLHFLYKKVETFYKAYLHTEFEISTEEWVSFQVTYKEAKQKAETTQEKSEPNNTSEKQPEVQPKQEELDVSKEKEPTSKSETDLNIQKEPNPNKSPAISFYEKIDLLMAKLKKINFPNDFTPEQKSCAKEILTKWHYGKQGLAFGCPQLDKYVLKVDDRLALLDFLVDNELIAAYGLGKFYIIKLDPEDKVPEDIVKPGSWTDKEARNKIKEFQKANHISLSMWSEEFLLKKFPLDEEQQSLKSIVTLLNSRKWPSTLTIFDDGIKGPILKFFADQGLIALVLTKDRFHNPVILVNPA